MRVVIQTLNSANKNGRIYTQDSFNNLPAAAFGTIGMPTDVQADVRLTASHKIDNLRFEDDALVGDLVILKTPHAGILQMLIDEDYEFAYRLAGIGKIEDGTVTNFELLSVNAVPRESAA